MLFRSVDFEAREGGGSCFVLRLPALVAVSPISDILPLKGGVKPPLA